MSRKCATRKLSSKSNAEQSTCWRLPTELWTDEIFARLTEPTDKRSLARVCRRTAVLERCPRSWRNVRRISCSTHPLNPAKIQICGITLCDTRDPNGPTLADNLRAGLDVLLSRFWPTELCLGTLPTVEDSKATCKRCLKRKRDNEADSDDVRRRITRSMTDMRRRNVDAGVVISQLRDAMASAMAARGTASMQPFVQRLTLTMDSVVTAGPALARVDARLCTLVWRRANNGRRFGDSLLYTNRLTMTSAFCALPRGGLDTLVVDSRLLPSDYRGDQTIKATDYRRNSAHLAWLVVQGPLLLRRLSSASNVHDSAVPQRLVLSPVDVLGEKTVLTFSRAADGAIGLHFCCLTGPPAEDKSSLQRPTATDFVDKWLESPPGASPARVQCESGDRANKIGLLALTLAQACLKAAEVEAFVHGQAAIQERTRFVLTTCVETPTDQSLDFRKIFSWPKVMYERSGNDNTYRKTSGSTTVEIPGRSSPVCWSNSPV